MYIRIYIFIYVYIYIYIRINIYIYIYSHTHIFFSSVQGFWISRCKGVLEQTWSFIRRRRARDRRDFKLQGKRLGGSRWRVLKVQKIHGDFSSTPSHTPLLWSTRTWSFNTLQHTATHCSTLEHTLQQRKTRSNNV